MAAIQGSAEGQKRVAWCYLFGTCLRDMERARSWYQLAAEQGDVEAMFAMMKFYHYGDGVQVDFREATKWALGAAERGYVPAQSYVGRSYEIGRGVAQDNIQALKWISIVASQGGKNAIKKRDELSKSMSSAQIAEAQRLATAWGAVK